MPLPSFFQRFRRAAPSGQAAASDNRTALSDVEAVRTRARRRLIGMAVLVGAGVIGFPWLFETQPRSMSQDVQVVSASSSAVASSSVGLASGAKGGTGRVGVASIVPAPESAAAVMSPSSNGEGASSAQGGSRSSETRRDAGQAASAGVSKTAEAVAPSASKIVPHAAPSVPQREMHKEAAKAPTKEASKPASKEPSKDDKLVDPIARFASKSPSKSADRPADKASEKLQPKSSDKRYVVQFGAFADVSAAHEARMKAERLGIKTYAQQVDTPAGKRIRVRVGPFADKSEAEKAAATMRKAGLPGAVLIL